MGFFLLFPGSVSFFSFSSHKRCLQIFCSTPFISSKYLKPIPARLKLFEEPFLFFSSKKREKPDNYELFTLFIFLEKDLTRFFT